MDNLKSGRIKDGAVNENTKTRHANVYDAVAGRVSTQSFCANPSSSTSGHGRGSSTSIFPALPPEEVLFRRLNAPVRYVENDYYFANENIPSDQALPDSDLLKAIHAYTSDLYGNLTSDPGQLAWQSMDETALIALGFLLEEAANEALGETGDMVFVEGEEITDAESETVLSTRTSSRRPSVSTPSRRTRVDTYSSSGVEEGDDELNRIRMQAKRRRKRRRLNSMSVKASDSEAPVT